MDKKILESFKTIFEDALVFDLDFYQWDKFVRLCVVSDHMPDTNGRLPLFAIDFLEVQLFNCELNHYNVKLQDDSRHFKWNIHDYKIDECDDGIKLKLIGAGVSPVLSIHCKDIVINKIGHSSVDKLFPKWDAPYSPFARPSIDELYIRFNQK